MKKHIALLLLCFLPAALGQVAPQSAPPAAAPAVASSYTDRAKFLTGMQLDSSSPLFPLENNDTWRSHAASFARLAARYNEAYFSKMRKWSSEQLAPRIPMGSPVVYFFGGPDAISALAYFPDAPVYILGGLEPVGAVPPPESIPPDRLQASLDNIRKSTEIILSFSFFITKDMKGELGATDFHGVLPLLYSFIVLSGADIVSTDYIGIRSNGSLVEYGANPSDGRGATPGVRIGFRKGNGPVQMLYYVQQNLVDDSLKGNGGFLKWTRSFGPANVYLKAASYLTHEPYFSVVRNFLLQDAVSVLQDDSGIPFSYFRNENWRLYFFGTFKGTLDIFKQYFQPDLVAAYAAPGVTPLPFGTGYKWRLGDSNLMLAVKQAAPKALPAPVQAR